jgi:hypothetical protein
MQSKPSTLVILETGGAWPVWLGADDRFISFVQGSDEHVSDFHERVESCVERLTTSSTSAVVVCGDRPAIESRRYLLVALVTHLERSGGGKLVLTGATRYGSRRALGALALEMAAFLDDVDSPVSCRVRAQPRAVPTEIEEFADAERDVA